MQLPEYMAKCFPGLHLEPPLFYTWPFGLRFELNVERHGFTYQQAVMQRARALYEEVFRPNDVCWIVEGSDRCVTHGFGRAGRGRYRTSRRNLFQVSKRMNLGIGGISGRLRNVFKADETTTRVSTLRWGSFSPQKIKYEVLLKLIAEHDFSGWKALLHERVFFINQTRNLIFHMYDDRGLDVIATRAEDLRSLYDARKAWLLEYDRQSIEALFDPVTPRTIPPRYR